MCNSTANVGRSTKGSKFFISHKERMTAARDMKKDAQHGSGNACIPLQCRYTVTLALRTLIRSCHDSRNEQGAQHALNCARELGLDTSSVVKYTHLEAKERA